jgi:hypothetical protein
VVVVGGAVVVVVGGAVVVVVGGTVVVVVGGTVVVVVRIDCSALRRAVSASNDSWRRAIWEVADRSAEASTRLDASASSSGTMALARATGPTSRATPAAPPMTARRATVLRVEAWVLGGWSVRSDIGEKTPSVR